ncbi:BTB/POZ domain-containing protein KCTD18 isoform X2 [Varanus komodoensis]|uniref:BTB/POZ domain-containing protein KCTD18 isoform X2 n=1 Tax=Varanus komodoensis TaxID=61221 RepID=UPI001CF7C295|nr:BTB/POZ domain-containing protein KCTD18 isoform X2 [Varanus komodoensis]
MENSKSEEVVDIIHLNVGGYIYTARRESLCRYKESMLASMFSGRFPLKMDDSGACLIERDGSLFKYLLDYLHGEVRLPEDKQTRLALQEEADYFGIPYPCSLADHLANEMETYSSRLNIELKKVLTDFCDSYGLICSKPTVWVLHYLNSSGASCESRIIGVFTTKADGTTAVEKELGGRIHSKNIYKREAGSNVQYIWSYYSVTELKKMLDAFESWEGRGVSYWRVPQELIECWTLEEQPLKGNVENMSPVCKRRIIDLSEEEDSQLTNRTIRRPIQFSGPSTSTRIKVKNSASLKIVGPTSSHSQVMLKRPCRERCLPCKEVSKKVCGNSSSLPKNSSASVRDTEDEVVCQRTLKAPLPKKPVTNRVVKLKRMPLCNELLTQHSSSALSKVTEQQVPLVAVASTSASPKFNEEDFGVPMKSINVKNHLPNNQLEDEV